MRDTKFIRLLRVFSAKELAEFDDFVRSPFFNKSALVSTLWQFTLGFAPDFNHSDLTHTAAYAALFPEKSVENDVTSKVNKIVSKLFQLAEKYIVYQRKNGSHADREDLSWQQELAILQFYNERHLTSFFENTLKVTEKLQRDFTARNAYFYYRQFRLNLEISNYQSYKADDGTGDVGFQATHDALDAFYLCAKIEQLCLMQNRERTTKFPYNYAMRDVLLSYLPTSEYYENPTIRLWYSALTLLNNPDSEAHYTALKRLLTLDSALLTPSEARNLYTYLENTARQVSRGNRAVFFNSLFELYKIQLEKAVIYIDNNLHPQVFYNIFAVANALREHDWLKIFLKEHQYRILPEYAKKDDVFSLCSAILSFNACNFEETLDFLNNIQVENINFKIIERRVRLKTYYELQEWDLLESLINSFRKFLTDCKAKLPETALQPQRDFIRVLSCLYKKEVTKINLEEVAQLPDYEWILQKIK